jgi:threonine dehydrogenase-like Zn-dependent dehydrogenase
MYLNSVNLRIARDNVRANIPPALHLAQSGRVDPMQVVSHVLDWETLPDALPELHTKPVFVRDPVAIPERFRAGEMVAW